MADALAELGSTAIQTTAATVQMGKINIYNAASGALAPPLPALSGLNSGAVAVVVKYAGDLTSNAVTVTRAGSDTFVGGATTEVLNSTGQVRRFQVVDIGGTKFWIALEGFGGGTGGGSGISPNTIDAKGDLLVGTADNTVARKAVGALGTWLGADPATSDGTKWDTIDIGDVLGLGTALAATQPLDNQLTELAALNPSNGDIIQEIGGVLTARTTAQVKADMALDNVENYSTSELWALQKDLTNTRLIERSTTITSSATPAIDTGLWDMFGITALAVDITSFTSGLTHTGTARGPTTRLWVYVVSTATRAITWGTSFEAGAVALPTTTSGTQRLDAFFIWNMATSKFRCMAQSSA